MTKQELINTCQERSIEVNSKMTVKQIEAAIAEHDAMRHNNDSKSADYFSETETRKQVAANRDKKAAKALAKSQRENKVNNTLVTATIRVRQRITKTAIIEIALSIAARNVKSATCQQIESFIVNEVSDSVYYKHESNVATRVRNHVRHAMKKLCIVDANDLIHFTDAFQKIVNDEKHIEQVKRLLAELKSE